MDPLLLDTIQIAEHAGRVIRKTATGAPQFKGEIDLVTRADLAAERYLVDALSTRLPEADVLAEEGSGLDRGSTQRWIVDPLDGTTNFAHGYPVYAVSIALERDGRLALGVVHDPTRNETFAASAGGGAFRNGDPIRVSTESDLGRSLLATGFPYDVRTHPRNNLLQLAAFLPKARGLRRGGSAALDLAYVAAGRFDGYWEEKLAPWDLAAGVLLVAEAGGRVTDYEGRAVDLGQGHVLAANPHVHAAMAEVIAGIEASGDLPPPGPRGS